MTRPEFDDALEALGLSPGAFARLTYTDPATVRGWGKERNVGKKLIDGKNTTQRKMQDIPGWVRPLLEAWTRSPGSLRAWVKIVDGP